MPKPAVVNPTSKAGANVVPICLTNEMVAIAELDSSSVVFCKIM